MLFRAIDYWLGTSDCNKKAASHEDEAAIGFNGGDVSSPRQGIKRVHLLSAAKQSFLLGAF